MRVNGVYTDIIDHATGVLQYPTMDKKLVRDNTEQRKKQSWLDSRNIQGLGFCVITYRQKRYEIQKIGCGLIGFGLSLESAIENMVDSGKTANQIANRKGPRMQDLK